MVLDTALGQVAMVVAAVMAGIGVYGLSASQNLIRQLLSVEVLFNSVLLLVVVLLSFNPVDATLFSIVLTAVVSGEVIVIVAIVVSLFRRVRSLESTVLEEEGV